MARRLRCPPEPRPASSAQGRPSKRQAPVRARAANCIFFESSFITRSTGRRPALARRPPQGPTANCSFDLRLGRVCRCASHAPDPCQLLRRDGLSRTPSAAGSAGPGSMDQLPRSRSGTVRAIGNCHIFPPRTPTSSLESTRGPKSLPDDEAMAPCLDPIAGRA